MKFFASLKAQARKLKQHTLTVYFAARDPRTPFLVRVLALLVAAYVLSPSTLSRTSFLSLAFWMTFCWCRWVWPWLFDLLRPK